ncbi:hypothetical protein J2Y02_003766 [Neobacillus drentensis]|nr:hypothetical protein [Neobacillus drentensis]
MWISDYFNGNTAYPPVDRLCVNTEKLFTYLLKNLGPHIIKPLIVHAILSLAVAAGHLFEEV